MPKLLIKVSKKFIERAFTFNMSQTTKSETENNSYKSTFRHSFYKVTQTQLNQYKVFWVIGLIILPILICTQIFKLYTYSYQWYQYLVFGTIYPLFFLVISLIPKLAIKKKKTLDAIKLVLLFVFVFGVIFYFIMSGVIFVLIASLLALIQLFLSKTGKKKIVNHSSYSNLSWIFQFVITTVAWAISLPFVMTGFRIVYSPNNPSNTVLFLIIVIIMFLICLNVYYTRKQTENFRFLSIGNILAVVIILLFSFRTDNYFYIISFHHWGVVLGPAEMVRQGGWLLWDVPSQYGFLGTLLLSWFPSESLWLSLYIISGSLNFLIGVLVFYSLRWPYNTIARFWFALALTLTSIFVRANIADLGQYRWESVDVYPSSGGFRYFWCYVSLLILFWQYRFRNNPKMQSKFFGIGNIVWLVAILWSAESGVYCSAIWLPAYVTMVLQHQLQRVQGEFAQKCIYKILFWLCMPFVLLLVTVGVIYAIYMTKLGHAPDWKNYLDYAAGTNYFQLSSDAGGAIWVFLGIYCFLCIFGLKLLSKGLNNPQLTIFLGFFGLIWSTSSYYVVREAPGAAVNSAPFFCLVLVTGLHLGQRQFKREIWLAAFKSFAVAVLTMLIVIGISKPSNIVYNLTQTNQNVNIEQKLPIMEESLNQLFAQAKVKPSDPIVYTGDINLLPAWYYENGNNSRLVANSSTWLPIYPDALLHVLPLERRQVYINRFTNHLKLSGWLVERVSGGAETGFEFDESMTWLHHTIESAYVATKFFANSQWRLTWYQFKG